jgi:ribosome maturation factor RimP
MAQRNRRDTPPRTRDRPRSGAGRGTAPGTEGSAGFERRSAAQLTAVRDRVQDIIEPVLSRVGYDLEDLKVRQTGRRHQLRVTVDGDGGVSLDVIADLSRAIADALDEAEADGQEVIPGEYQLEVSSPGVDRPLTLPRHWRRAVGRMISVKVPGGALITGRLTAADATSVTLEIAEKKTVRVQTYPLAELGPGHVQIEFHRLDEISDEDLVEIPDDDADSDHADSDDADLGDTYGDAEEDEGADDEDVEEQ